MAEPIISVSQLGKSYTITHEGNSYQTLREVFSSGSKRSKELFWALKNVSFDLQRGEALGIIGRNGAGKTTLLKLLSRITEPTRGRIIINGRIASLLEVGTGFHPELTGRENIFLNGAILGMTRSEIRRKFDEIVEFAEVSRFLDTPVKKYSSGMYVRLAFAVAAHLEPEILIVDEVLAVGDAVFQKKCLGKMEEVTTRDGRTILFVSHNMSAIKNLCTKCLYLKEGEIVATGTTEEVIGKYYDSNNNTQHQNGTGAAKRNSGFIGWEIIGAPEYSIKPRDPVIFRFKFNSLSEISGAELGLVIRNADRDIIFSTNSRDNQNDYITVRKGLNYFNFSTRLPIRHGSYELDIILVAGGKIIDHWVPERNLTIKNELSTVLDEHWQGVLNEEVSFNHEVDA